MRTGKEGMPKKGRRYAEVGRKICGRREGGMQKERGWCAEGEMKVCREGGSYAEGGRKICGRREEGKLKGGGKICGRREEDMRKEGGR